MSDDDRDPWHFDRRVPIAFLTAMLVQTLAGLFALGWFSAKVDSRIVGVEAAIAAIVVVDRDQDVLLRAVEQSAIRRDGQISNVLDAIKRIEKSIDVIANPKQNGNGTLPIYR